MKPDRLVVFRGADGEWRWQRRNGANGRIVAGEGYRRRSHAIGMVFALHEWAREVHIADGRDAGRVIERRA